MNFAKLNSDAVFGRSDGKILWQPRIICWYHDKIFSGEPLPEKYAGLSIYDIYRKLGCSARLYEFGECFERQEDYRVQQTFQENPDGKITHTIETPAGCQTEILQKSKTSQWPKHLKREVETEKELETAAWREENCSWKWNGEKYNKLIEEIGDLGAPAVIMPRMNIQSLYLEKMGIENGIFAMQDWPETVDRYFNALEESHSRLIELINDSPVNLVNFGENIHSDSLPPYLFEKYHLPACRRRCDKLHSAGKFVYSHWDGNCRPLLKYARQTGLDGIEAITPTPQGDVTLEEIKEALGDDMYLIDGIPAVFFDETYSEKTLTDCTERIIELFAPKLILGISDEISSTGDIERINLITDIVNSYNSQFETVNF
ncbi:uroporphyrinogen decarboxylase family protein [Sedimentisphaera salicampi]|uniref:Uroporphyrinogen decarboxylase (URO-D) n=1 Tax=Sedimentisphaera salicampi TaxID=1941349 RepID=A0A1W6LJ24_9BACT|nr:uroporphyrinogen decarboxylase family protein [Sedimentisphaera salicampi]ARN55787.1 Uroporphyrinogen decarboxylase (URO-D) [Sedimentisphaera salicampi]